MIEKNEKFNFDTIKANIDKIKEIKSVTKEKKLSTSIKPLKFTPNENDSPLKAIIIERINSMNLTYSDLYNYCTTFRGDDPVEGQRLGSNIINGLRNRPTMLDTTLSMLCNFLNLDILFKEKSKDKEEEGK